MKKKYKKTFNKTTHCWRAQHIDPKNYSFFQNRNSSGFFQQTVKTVAITWESKVKQQWWHNLRQMVRKFWLKKRFFSQKIKKKTTTVNATKTTRIKCIKKGNKLKKIC